MNDSQAHHLVSKELRPGERLLWHSVPKQGLRLQTSDWFLIPFSIMWGGFACFWEYSALSGGAPFFFVLWGVPFVLVGLYMIAGRFFVDSKQRGKTAYGLTDRRLLIVTSFIRQKVDALDLASLTQTTISENADGSGTILMGSDPGLRGWLAGSGWPTTGKNLPPRLDGIQRVREVYDRILSARESAKAH